jgi:hypothetical protein
MARLVFIPVSEAVENTPTGAPRKLAFPMKGMFSDPLPLPEALSFFPLQMTIEKAVEYWWRVAEWKASYSVDTFSGELILSRYKVGIFSDVLVVDEKDLCFPDCGWWRGVAQIPGGTIGTDEIRVFLSLMMDDIRYNTDHSNIRPSISVSSEATIYSGDTTVDMTTSAGDLGVTGEMNMDGSAISISGSNDVFSLSIVPHRYYSYSGIWNTETGEKN